MTYIFSYFKAKFYSNNLINYDQYFLTNLFVLADFLHTPNWFGFFNKKYDTINIFEVEIASSIANIAV